MPNVFGRVLEFAGEVRGYVEKVDAALPGVTSAVAAEGNALSGLLRSVGELYAAFDQNPAGLNSAAIAVSDAFEVAVKELHNVQKRLDDLKGGLALLG